MQLGKQNLAMSCVHAVVGFRDCLPKWLISSHCSCPWTGVSDLRSCGQNLGFPVYLFCFSPSNGCDVGLLVFNVDFASVQLWFVTFSCATSPAVCLLFQLIFLQRDRYCYTVCVETNVQMGITITSDTIELNLG